MLDDCPWGNVAMIACLCPGWLTLRPQLQEAAAALQNTLGDPAAVVLLSSAGEGKVGMAAAFSPQVVKGGLQAGKFIGGIAKICGGGGGGRPNLAQAGGKDASKLDEAAAAALSQLTEQL